MRLARLVLRYMALSITAAAVLAYAVGLTVSHTIAKAGSGPPRPGWSEVHGAMRVYRYEYDAFPYSAQGPEHALYLLRPWFWNETDKGLRDSHERGGPDASDRRGGRSRAYWDEERGVVVGSSLDYLNLPPSQMAALPDDTIVLSYRPDAWDIRWQLYYMRKDIAENSQARGVYYPWVRPRRMVGLPGDELWAIGDYGVRWGVYDR